jgi:metal-responsive CopG/Arc/MetJ family transcriptional regulator
MAATSNKTFRCADQLWDEFAEVAKKKGFKSRADGLQYLMRKFVDDFTREKEDRSTDDIKD